jgi:predicted nucleotidyltransferase
MYSIIINNLGQITKLCHRHKVEKLFAFGSVCTDNFTDENDVDLLISFQDMDYSDYAEHYFSMAEQLERVLNRPVDLVTVKSLSNPYFISSVDRTKTLFYGSGN